MKTVTVLILAIVAKFTLNPQCQCFTQYYLVTAADHWEPKVVGYGNSADVGKFGEADIQDWDTFYKDTVLAEPDSLIMKLHLVKKVSKGKYIATDEDRCTYKLVHVNGNVNNYDYLVWLSAPDTVLK